MSIVEYFSADDVAWQADAPCATADSGFTPDVETDAEAAVAEEQWYRSCPVRTRCLAWAVLRGAEGYWAGTSTYQRNQLRACAPGRSARCACPPAWSTRARRSSMGLVRSLPRLRPPPGVVAQPQPSRSPDRSRKRHMPHTHSAQLTRWLIQELPHPGGAMARSRNTRQSVNNKTGIGCGVLALLLFVGGCNQLLGIGDDEEQKTADCAMELTAGAGPKGWIGGGSNGGGGGGFTSGSGGGGSSSGGGTSTGGGGLGGTDVPNYEPGMDPADVTPDMEATAEAEHGDMRAVGTELIWFDKRTNEPFPWEKKAYEKAKREADAVDAAAKALEDDC